MRRNKMMLQVIGGLMMIILTPAVILTVHTNAFRYNELSGSAQNIANEMLKINGYSLLLAMGLLVLLMIQAKTKFHRKNRVSENIGEIYFPQIGLTCKTILQIGLVVSIYILQYHAYLYPFLSYIEKGQITLAMTYYNISLVYKIAVFAWVEVSIGKNLLRENYRKNRYVLK